MFVPVYLPTCLPTYLQPFTKYLRHTVVFMWNSKIQESVNFYSSIVLCYNQKYFILGGRPGTKL